MKKQIFNIIALLLVFLSGQNAIAFVPRTGIFLQIAMFCVFLFTIISGKSFSINKKMIIVILLAVFSIVLNNVPIYFRSWERLISFICVLIVAFPIIQNNKLNIIRIKMFQWMIVLCVIVTLASFVCRFIGINYASLMFQDGKRLESFFGGITYQSMILGPVASISTIYALYKLLFSTQKKKKYLFSIIVILSFYVSILAASRSAIASEVCSAIFILYKYAKRPKQFINYTFVVIIVGVATFFLNPNKSAIEYKQRSQKEQGLSRKDKWENRINEFNSAPFFGIGFASVGENTDDYSAGGTIEPGSAWLFMLSSCGIFCFLLLLYIFIKSMLFAHEDKESNAALFGALVLFFIIHMIAEGYIFASGSMLCLFMWLSLGMLETYREDKETAITYFLL